MPNLRTALRLAAHDKEFAEALISKPESFKSAFNLSESQVAGLKKAVGLMPIGGLRDVEYDHS